MAVSRSEFEFLTPPDADLECRICHQVAREPWQHGKCGRLFCKECLDSRGESLPCPECNNTSEEPWPVVYFEDTRSECFLFFLLAKSGYSIGLSCSLNMHREVTVYM